MHKHNLSYQVLDLNQGIKAKLYMCKDIYFHLYKKTFFIHHVHINVHDVWKSTKCKLQDKINIPFVLATLTVSGIYTCNYH